MQQDSGTQRRQNITPLIDIKGRGARNKTRARINAGLRLARWELNHKKIIANCFEQDLGSINLPHGSYLLLSPPVVTILHVTFLMSTGTYIKLSWASNHLRIWKQLHGNGVKGAEGVAFFISFVSWFSWGVPRWKDKSAMQREDSHYSW